MSSQETSARRRSRLAVTALVALAFTAAVLVVAIQASSIRSTRIGPQVTRVPAETPLTANPDLPTSSHVAKGCWHKFGCGRSATTTANPELRTSSHVAKGCWHKFGCGHGATTTAKRP
jgi:hypothetical protein